MLILFKLEEKLKINDIWIYMVKVVSRNKNSLRTIAHNLRTGAQVQISSEKTNCLAFRGTECSFYEN